MCSGESTPCSGRLYVLEVKIHMVLIHRGKGKGASSQNSFSSGLDFEPDLYLEQPWFIYVEMKKKEKALQPES